MASSDQCRAVTKAGTRCTRKVATAGFCTTHFPKPKKAPLIERAKTVGQVVTTATGVITLLQKAVELWQSLPFGPGPEMSEPYHYLVREFGPSWGIQRDRYTPGNYSSASVDWAEAVEIYEFAKWQLDHAPADPDRQAQTSAIIGVLTERFVDGLPPHFRQMLFEAVGEDEGDA